MARFFAAAALLTAGFFAGVAQYHAQEGKSEVECPVSGKPVDKDASIDYKGGKLYFCCPNCPAAFKENTAKYAAKANQQLVETRQAKQAACPFTGKPLNPETKIDVQGAAVCFCCPNCQAKAKDLEGAEQVQAIFNDKAFKTAGYKVGKGE